MTTQEFCLYLDEVLCEMHALSEQETTDIRLRLASVFRHDIDPSMGDATQQAALSRIHDATDKERHRKAELPVLKGKQQ
jgi:hypothetical protein